MPRTTHQSKVEKAKYDKQRKADERKERRFTKPLKMFFQRKYPTYYGEFVKFFKYMENEYPGKKDLTKTDMFKEFLTNHPPQEKSITLPDEATVATLFPNLVSTLEPSTLSTEATTSPSQATTSFPNLVSPVKAVEVLESPASEDQTPNMVETSTSERRTPNTVSDLLDEIFGPGGIDDEDLQQIQIHSENSDEGIELNHFDELAFDLEPFDFELETEGF